MPNAICRYVTQARTAAESASRILRAPLPAIVLLALAAGPVATNADEPRPDASASLEVLQRQLLHAERQLIDMHGRLWQDLARYERERILEGLRHFLQMAPREREAVRLHAARFDELDPAERHRLCRRFRIERGYYAPLCLTPR